MDSEEEEQVSDKDATPTAASNARPTVPAFFVEQMWASAVAAAAAASNVRPIFPAAVVQQARAAAVNAAERSAALKELAVNSSLGADAAKRDIEVAKRQAADAERAASYNMELSLIASFESFKAVRLFHDMRIQNLVGLKDWITKNRQPGEQYEWGNCDCCYEMGPAGWRCVCKEGTAIYTIRLTNGHAPGSMMVINPEAICRAFRSRGQLIKNWKDESSPPADGEDVPSLQFPQPSELLYFRNEDFIRLITITDQYISSLATGVCPGLLSSSQAVDSDEQEQTPRKRARKNNESPKPHNVKDDYRSDTD